MAFRKRAYRLAADLALGRVRVRRPRVLGMSLLQPLLQLLLQKLHDAVALVSRSVAQLLENLCAIAHQLVVHLVEFKSRETKL